MRIKTAICTSIGMKRKSNQDNFYVNGLINKNAEQFLLKDFLSSKKEQILCVCDGMGGVKNGDIASFIAVESLDKYRKKYSNLFSRFDEHMNAYVQSANKNICTYIKNNGEERMGTTMVTICISPKDDEAVVANVGDSKAYLYRDGAIKKLSEDHNQAQSMVNIGIITEEEARTHKDKSKLTQYLGIFQNEMLIEPFVSDNIMIKKNDIFLLCSDGLTDMLDNREIENILKQKDSVKYKVRKLVDTANKKGGKDNITIILAQAI